MMRTTPEPAGGPSCPRAASTPPRKNTPDPALGHAPIAQKVPRRIFTQRRARAREQNNLKRAVIKKLARFAGAPRISGDVYDYVKVYVDQELQSIIFKLWSVMNGARRKTITSSDVTYILKHYSEFDPHKPPKELRALTARGKK